MLTIYKRFFLLGSIAPKQGLTQLGFHLVAKKEVTLVAVVVLAVGNGAAFVAAQIKNDGGYTIKLGFVSISKLKYKIY